MQSDSDPLSIGVDLIAADDSGARHPSTLPATLLAHANRTPTRTFVEVWSPSRGLAQSVSYGGLADCMIVAALWLRDGIGLSAGEYIAMLAPNSIAYLSFSLGAMCIGATSINLNWRNPPEVNERLLADLQPRIVIAGNPFRAEAAAIHTKLGLRIALLEAVCNMDCASLPFDPAPHAPSEEIKASVARLDPDVAAAVFFTGGTTGTPKAVPHSHRGLLWFADACLQTIPEGFAPSVEHAGTACFTPFFHVMGFVANFVFNLHARCRVFVLADDTKLTPSLILAACRELRPSVLNTVPWVVEGLVEIIRAGEQPDSTSVLASLHLITYGGAALAPHCAPVLKHHGIVVACTYGQTELAGPVMFGKPGGDPNALRPLAGVGFELKPCESDAPGEGELILLGNASATRGYLRLPSETKQYRSLSDGSETLTPTQRFSTNDRFTTRRIDGEEWLLYLCRADDLLVHTSGEMSNPLPTEGQLIAACPSLLNAVCVVGTNMARCMVLLELASGVDAAEPTTLTALRAGLAKANSLQPQYSRVLEQHALLVPHGTLPLTVKGTVQRGRAEKLFAADLDACRRGAPLQPTLAPVRLDAGGGSGAGAGTIDSLDLSAATSKAGGASGGGHFGFLSGARFVLSLWIVVTHTTERFKLLHDRAIQHSYIGVTFFVVLAGFSTHYTFSGHELLPSGQKWRTFGHFAVRRIDRVVLSTWISMAAAQLVEGSIGHSFTLGWSFSHIVRCYTFLEYFTGDLNEYNGAVPLFGSCPNGPVWTISSLIFCWLTYPFYQPILDRLVRPSGDASKAVYCTAALVLACYAPQYLAIAVTSDATATMNVLHTWPPFYLADFVCGCTAAACVRAHADFGGHPGSSLTSDKSAASSGNDLVDVMDNGALLAQEEGRMPGSIGATTSRFSLHKLRNPRTRGMLADVMILLLVLFVFTTPVFPAEGLVARLYGMPNNFKHVFLEISPGIHRLMDTSVGMGCHIWSIPVALWVYCVCAREEGVGVIARALNHPALTSLGNYALHIYLFTFPVKFYFQWVFDGRIWGEGNRDLYEPGQRLRTNDEYVYHDKLQASETWTLEFITLLVVSVLYAHHIEEPLVQRFRRFTDRHTTAPRVKTHQQ